MLFQGRVLIKTDAETVMRERSRTLFYRESSDGLITALLSFAERLFIIMILGSNQPYFLPYIGFWQMISAVDLYEICDDFSYIKGGWVNRNRILINGKPSFFNIEVQHATSNKAINELELSEINVEKKLWQLTCAYAKAPYFKNGMAIAEQVFSCPDKNMARFLITSIKVICDYLDIKTKIILSSEYDRDRSLKKEQSIYQCCKIWGADTYYNAIGGQELYSFDDFRKNGINLAFIKTNDIRYHQFYGQEFVPNLSILDVIMFNPVEKIQEMLKEYTLITDECQPRL